MSIEAELYLPEEIRDVAAGVLEIFAETYPQCHIVLGEMTSSKTIDLQIYGDVPVPKTGQLIQVRDTVQELTRGDHTLGFESYKGKTSYP
jgi:hypothetical protein